MLLPLRYVSDIGMVSAATLCSGCPGDWTNLVGTRNLRTRNLINHGSLYCGNVRYRALSETCSYSSSGASIATAGCHRRRCILLSNFLTCHTRAHQHCRKLAVLLVQDLVALL